LNVIEPSVVDTPKPAILQTAITQVGPAVRAVQTQETSPSAFIPKKHQLLSENPNGKWWATFG
jgi:hypothetical protein